MRECFQFESMNMLDHGESVREWYEDLRSRVLGEAYLFTWRLPSWIDSPLIKEHFLTANDEVIRLYQIYHDCGKPLCRTVDAEGKQHFPNHAEVSKARWLECGGSQEVADERPRALGTL